MASFTFNSLQHDHLISLAFSRYHSKLSSYKFTSFSHFLTTLPLNATFKTKLVRKSLLEAHTSSANLGALEREPSTKPMPLRDRKETGRVDPLVERLLKDSGKNHSNSVVEEKSGKKFSRDTRKTPGYRERRGISSKRSPRDDTRGVKSLEIAGNVVVNEKRVKKDNGNLVGKGNKEKKPKKDKDSPEVKLRVGLDMCSKRGDVMEALSLYDSARREGVKLGQHHYTVLLYLCSSAAAGVVQPAKSGSGTRALNALASSSEVAGTLDSPVSANGRLIGPFKSNETIDNSLYVQNSKCTSNNKNIANFSKDLLAQNTLRDDDEFFPEKDVASNQEEHSILVSDDVKKYALEQGFEIYEDMCMAKVQMNEAALTSVARMAMAMGDGDMALEMVKQMKTLGINRQLRSYGPALSTFCSNGDVDKAFAVEQHMLEHGICPEEPELEALLRVSVGAGKGEKVYYLLHKLRTTVRKVSPSTADLIIDWFNSNQASRLGKRKWDKRLIKEAMKTNGGGWHGQGWLGKGKWIVSNTTIGTDGVCNCCGVHLATIDLDPIETENFAKSVASIAIMREKRSNFEKFQKWLDYYGPFEAVVDAANVGLYSQKRFIPSRINAVVNGIRHKLPSKRFPLIILHNKRVTGNKMDEPINRALVEKWKNSDALYATPTGSNDDWYWLYAAIKFKCLLVTNDEMRDHIFQLLGNDFFPKWKERHQVHFSFSDTGPEFHMPPPCSVVIQESEEGHWHIPVESDHDIESERRWLCVTRSKPHMVWQNSSTTSEDLRLVQDMESARSATLTESTNNMPHLNHDKMADKPQEMYKNLRDILSASISSDHSTLLSEIEAAELIGGCTIDFQI